MVLFLLHGVQNRFWLVYNPNETSSFTVFLDFFSSFYENAKILLKILFLELQRTDNFSFYWIFNNIYFKYRIITYFDPILQPLNKCLWFIKCLFNVNPCSMHLSGFPMFNKKKYWAEKPFTIIWLITSSSPSHHVITNTSYHYIETKNIRFFKKINIIHQ
jgi:hypothetical protein